MALPLGPFVFLFLWPQLERSRKSSVEGKRTGSALHHFVAENFLRETIKYLVSELLGCTLNLRFDRRTGGIADSCWWVSVYRPCISEFGLILNAFVLLLFGFAKSSSRYAFFRSEYHCSYMRFGSQWSRIFLYRILKVKLSALRWEATYSRTPSI